MKSNFLVSVIIPVYNVNSYLTEALDSVLCQTYSRLEIIVIDDGSTDGSELICDEYSRRDPRIRLIHQKNQGLSAARNAGLDIMTGEIVAFLDSDDAYHPAFIETMLTTLIQKQVDVVMSESIVCHTKGAMTPYLSNVEDESITFTLYNRNEFFQAIADGFSAQSVWDKIYRKNLWDGIRFPVGHVYEDLDTTYKIIEKCGKICVIDKSLYLYRKRPGSITEAVSQKSIYDCLRAKEHYLDFVEKNTPEIFNNEHMEKTLSRHFRGMISLYGRYAKRTNDNPHLLRELRKKIVETGNKLHLKSAAGSLKILFGLIRFCPICIRILYRVIYPFRNIMLRSIRK